MWSQYCAKSSALGASLAAAADWAISLVWCGKTRSFPPRVQVEARPQVLERHGRALDVPSWPSLPPGRAPARLARLGGLPEREVERVALGLARLDPRAGEQVVQVAPGEPAVVAELPDGVVDIAIPRRIGVALRHQRLDEGHDLRDVPRHARGHVGALNPERGHGVVEGLRESRRHGDGVLAALPGARDDLVVHVCEVADVLHLEPARPQMPDDHVPDHVHPSVAEVRQVVDGGPAHIDAELARDEGDELALLAGEGVVDLDAHRRSRGTRKRILSSARTLMARMMRRSAVPTTGSQARRGRSPSRSTCQRSPGGVPRPARVEASPA